MKQLYLRAITERAEIAGLLAQLAAKGIRSGAVPIAPYVPDTHVLDLWSKYLLKCSPVYIDTNIVATICGEVPNIPPNMPFDSTMFTVDNGFAFFDHDYSFTLGDPPENNLLAKNGISLFTFMFDSIAWLPITRTLPYTYKGPDSLERENALACFFFCRARRWRMPKDAQDFETFKANKLDTPPNVFDTYLNELCWFPCAFPINTHTELDAGYILDESVPPYYKVVVEYGRSLLYALIAFMNEKRAADTKELPVGGDDTRKLRKRHMHPPPSIRVVELRAQETPSHRNDDDSAPAESAPIDRDYSWTVRGHIHTYCVGTGRADRIKKWTPPYIKGDPTKPLRNPAKLFAVVR